MKIFIEQVPGEGLNLDYREPEEAFGYLKGEEEGAGTRVEGPVHVRLFVERTSTGATVSGSIEGTARMTCSRCLEEISLDVGHDFIYDCLPDDEMGEGEELSGEEADIYYYSGGEIDITALVQEQAALVLPMRPLCREDCKGFCPKCGANLNLGDCGCKKGPADLRFAALKDIKIK